MYGQITPAGQQKRKTKFLLLVFRNSYVGVVQQCQYIIE